MNMLNSTNFFSLFPVYVVVLFAFCVAVIQFYAFRYYPKDPFVLRLLLTFYIINFTYNASVFVFSSISFDCYQAATWQKCKYD